jgi:hypothetical protein
VTSAFGVILVPSTWHTRTLVQLEHRHGLTLKAEVNGHCEGISDSDLQVLK